MSGQPQPNQTDRIVSHVIVGLVVGALVGRKAGVWGFVLGGLLAAGAHELADAPGAQIIADLTQ
jgi:hypothetical protein